MAAVAPLQTAPPTDEEVIDLTGDDDTDEEEPRPCAICFRSMMSARLAAGGCGHVFCKGCLEDSLVRVPECPTCRSPMTTCIPLFF